MLTILTKKNQFQALVQTVRLQSKVRDMIN